MVNLTIRIIPVTQINIFNFATEKLIDLITP
jgi:hypothetical protein